MTDTPPSPTDRDAQITALIDRVAFLEAGDIEEITDAGCNSTQYQVRD
jgi:hypothetical protein